MCDSPSIRNYYYQREKDVKTYVHEANFAKSQQEKKHAMHVHNLELENTHQKNRISELQKELKMAREWIHQLMGK